MKYRSNSIVCRIACVVLVLALSYGAAAAQDGVWNTVSTPEGQLFALDCLDSATCFTVGEIGLGLDTYILRSTDEGRTWEEVYRDPGSLTPPYRLPLRMKSVACIPPNTVIAAADSGNILRSFDRGETWERYVVSDTDSQAGYIVLDGERRGGAMVLHTWGSIDNSRPPDRMTITTDGGLTWTPIPRPEAVSPGYAIYQIAAMAFAGADSLFCLIPGLKTDTVPYVIGRSTDRGASWETLTGVLPGKPRLAYAGIQFFSAKHGVLYGARTDVAEGWHGVVYETRDGGSTWTTKFDDTLVGTRRLGFQQIAFLDTLRGIGCGSGYIYRTLDGGASWTQEPVDFKFSFDCHISWPAPSIALAVSGGGGIARYEPMVNAVPISRGAAEVDLRLYPNPLIRGSDITLSLALERASVVTVRVVDMLGVERLAIPESRLEPGVNRGTIDLSALEAGNYLVEVVVGEDRRMLPVTVVR